MARQKANPAATDPRESVERVPFSKARELMTVQPGDGCWKGTLPKRKKFDGLIVRLQPPATATDEEVAALRKFYEARGAERVFVSPRARSAVLPEKAMTTSVPKETARQAVVALVAESNAKDKASLHALCELVMSEEGL